ncbi:hypothetical protein MNV49_004816 [Pseudohyphozyma bogoriensis]|nr:hypothetical protein MNV49_004816 [Pseudohyphozyma bogoriensis]
MNHLSHTLAPLFFFTAFLLTLLTFLAPVHVFESSVSLLQVAGNTTLNASTLATTAAPEKRWIDAVYGSEEAALVPRSIHGRGGGGRMVQVHIKRKAANATSSAAAASASDVSVKVVFGPMGACYGASGNLTCQAASFTPIFTTMPDLLPSNLIEILPDQFPLAPTALFLGVLSLTLTLTASLLSSLPFHASKLSSLEKHRLGLTKVVVFGGGVGIAVGLIATIALRLQLGAVVNKWEAMEGAADAAFDVSLGTGFAQLFAGWGLGAGGVIFTTFALFG